MNMYRTIQVFPKSVADTEEMHVSLRSCDNFEEISKGWFQEHVHEPLLSHQNVEDSKIKETEVFKFPIPQTCAARSSFKQKPKETEAKQLPIVVHGFPSTLACKNSGLCAKHGFSCGTMEETELPDGIARARARHVEAGEPSNKLR